MRKRFAGKNLFQKEDIEIGNWDQRNGFVEGMTDCTLIENTHYQRYEHVAKCSFRGRRRLPVLG